MNEANKSEYPTFKVGETYATRSICDNDCIYSATVVRRTAKTVTFREDGREYTRRISKGLSEFCGCEAVHPHGTFSMCPTFTANRTLADVTGEKAAPKPADEREEATADDGASGDGRVLVAVYGTLMRGERNEHWAREAGAEIVGEGTVRGRLYDTGFGYPVLIVADQGTESGDAVAVEVLATDAAGVAHMDVLEGYPKLYGRETVTVRMSDGYTLSALVYTPNDETMCRVRIWPNEKWVADWRAYRALREGR